MFYVGQKVVCVKNAPPICTWGEHVPRKGTVYTVRQAKHDGIRLVEIVNPELQYRQGLSEMWFANHGFRPVVEKKTDIEWAHELCRNPKAPAKTNEPVGVV